MAQSGPVNVVFDSSSLRGLRPGSIMANRLRELVQLDAVAVYVPWIVEQEVSTGLAGDAQPLNARQRRAAAWFPRRERDRAREAFESVDNFLRDSERLVEAGVKEFLDSLKAERLSLPRNAAEQVFADYFSGHPPFGKRKSRNDIPDAFIKRTIESAAASLAEPLHVVAADERLRVACSSISGVVVSARIDEVLKLPTLAPAVPECDFRAFFREVSPSVEAAIEDAIGEAVTHSEVTSHIFPSDNQDATITAYGSMTDLQIDFDGLEVISERVALISVECCLEDCLLNLYIFKSDFWAGDYNEHFSVSECDWNDHYLEAQTELNVNVSAVLAVELERAGDRYALRELEISRIDHLAVPE